MKHLFMATLLLVSMILVPGAASGQPEIFIETFASGAQEVPTVGTKTRGILRLAFRKDLSRVNYSLVVKRGVGIAAADLHCGVAGANGQVVALLFTSGPVNVDGPLAAGVLRNIHIIPEPDCGGLPVTNIASLLAAIREDLIYLNVHSLANPAGEVRGQVLHLH